MAHVRINELINKIGIQLIAFHIYTSRADWTEMDYLYFLFSSVSLCMRIQKLS